MLNPKRENLAGKLLLSSALVAVSLGYGWWQRTPVQQPALAMAPMPLPPAKVAPHDAPPPAPTTLTESATQDAAAAPATAPGPVASNQATAASPPPMAVAKAAPRTVTPAPPPVAQASQNNDIASSPPPPALTTQQAMQMNLPTEGPSPALPWVTGTPDPGAVALVPTGSHLEDGDYVSNKHELMWGDVKLKIAIRGGLITGVQMLDFPDHRSQSLYLSQMALPILESEVIKNQKSMVDTVSSATDTSYTFQDAIAEAIASAVRG